jgi:hypothetical protein
MGRIRSVSDFDTILRNSIKELQTLFCIGNASSCDINEKGDTLLEVRICVILLSGHFR